MLQGTKTSRWRIKQSLRWLWRRHHCLQTAKQNVLLYFCTSGGDPGESQTHQSTRWDFSRHCVFCLGPLAFSEWKSSPHCYLVWCIRDSLSLSSFMQTRALCIRYHVTKSNIKTSQSNSVRSYTDWTDEIRHLEKVKGHSDKTLTALSQAK